MKKLFCSLLIFYFISQLSDLYAQNNMGIGTLTPNAKALLDLTASDKGLLVPRLTTTQRIAINPTGNADAALLVYDTDDSLFYFWNSAQWVPFPQQGGSNNIALNFDANTGVLSLTDNGGTLTTNIPPDNDSNPNNELITNVVFNANGNILTINEGGNTWSTTISIVDPDSDPANELNTSLFLNGTVLNLTDAGGTLNVDLSGLVNNTNNDWKLLGNAGTSPATNFLGTTDNQDLVFRTNNIENIRLLSNGNVGIGTTSPVSRLHINNGGIDVTNTGNAYMVFDGGISNSPGNQISFIDLKLNGTLRGNIAVSEGTLGSPLELNSATNGDVVMVMGGGDVGIGTATPGRRLEVNSAMKFTNSGFDANDGVLGTAPFGAGFPGLSIVGIRTDGTYRKIQTWGEITQNENGGTNTWAGQNRFTALAGNGNRPVYVNASGLLVTSAGGSNTPTSGYSLMDGTAWGSVEGEVRVVISGNTLFIRSFNEQGQLDKTYSLNDVQNAKVIVTIVNDDVVGCNRTSKALVFVRNNGDPEESQNSDLTCNGNDNHVQTITIFYNPR